METQQTKVSGKLAEELIKSTAREKETTEPAVAKESSLNIMQEFLVSNETLCLNSLITLTTYIHI
jgi:hypothetical protein